jgi:hypothetical protein
MLIRTGRRQNKPDMAFNTFRCFVPSETSNLITPWQKELLSQEENHANHHIKTSGRKRYVSIPAVSRFYFLRSG